MSADDLSSPTKFLASLLAYTLRALVIGGLLGLIASGFTDPGSSVPLVVGGVAGVFTFVTDWLT